MKSPQLLTACAALTLTAGSAFARSPPRYTVIDLGLLGEQKCVGTLNP